jgi:glycosyltransferase involved in cell wall biosynthesis
MPFVSVALCTYNGARYLDEQLASIATQSRSVDEIVVCDDGSTDQTPQLVADFAQRVPFPVRFFTNPTNLGSTTNFEKALGYCQGDVLLLCDQDDRWHPDRVARTLAYFDEHPEMDAVFSNAQVMDEHSRPTGRTIWEEIQFTPELRQKWRQGGAHEILFNGYVVTGATLAVRQRILPLVVPFPTHFDKLIHDGWIALVLAVKGSIGFIDDELIWYRRHPSQQVGFGPQNRMVTLWERWTRPRREKLHPLEVRAAELEQLYRALKAKPELPDDKLLQLAQLAHHYRMRASLPRSRWRRLRPIWNDVKQGFYKFSSPTKWWLPALGDLFE